MRTRPTPGRSSRAGPASPPHERDLAARVLSTQAASGGPRSGSAGRAMWRPAAGVEVLERGQAAEAQAVAERPGRCAGRRGRRGGRGSVTGTGRPPLGATSGGGGVGPPPSEMRRPGRPRPTAPATATMAAGRAGRRERAAGRSPPRPAVRRARAPRAGAEVRPAGGPGRGSRGPDRRPARGQCRARRCRARGRPQARDELVIGQGGGGRSSLGHPAGRERFAQPPERPRGPRLHGAPGEAERLGRLGLGEVKEEPRAEDLAVVIAQRLTARRAAPGATPRPSPRPPDRGRARRPDVDSTSATRSASPARRPLDRRRLRASLATIRSSHGRNGAPSRNRGRAA